MRAEQSHVKTELKNLQNKVYDASNIFVQLTGMPLPKGGYVIVDDLYNTVEEDHSIIVKEAPEKSGTVLSIYKMNLGQLRANQPLRNSKILAIPLPTSSAISDHPPLALDLKASNKP